MAGRGDASFAWELCKENVAPVARGRNVEKLNALLVKANSVELKASLAEMERSYEVKIKNAMSHDDPLETWVAYQKWTEENFPSDTAKNFTILERATRAFTADRRYRNDDRYLRFWIQYIDRIDKPIEVFKYLYKNKIGDKLALFYIAWALLLERKGDVKNAELIYAKGLQKKAEPFDALERKHSEFERRVSQKWLSAATSRDDEEDDAPRGRQALAPTAAPTIVVPVVPRRQAASTAVSNASSFAIYSENDMTQSNSSVLSENKSSAWKVLPSSKVVNKENEQKPSIWTGAGLATRPGHAPLTAYDEPTGPPVEIFVDESAATRTLSRKRPHAGHDTGRALRPRLDERSMTPAGLPSNDENPTQPSVSTKLDPSARKSTKPAVKRDILRVNIEMLKVPGQDDLFCFEEVRAQRYWEAKAAKAQAAAVIRVPAVPVATSKPVRNGFLVDDTDDDVVQQAPAPQKWQPTVRTSHTNMAPGGILAVTGAMHPLAAIADDAKYAQDDMTFNTRMAYEDIGSMFCSPTKAAPVVASPTKEQLTSFRKSNWVPKTEEPIVRKLHFSAFKAKPNGRDDDDDDDDESTPAVDANPAFLIFTEENDKSGPVVPHKKDPNRKALGDRNDIAKSTKKTNKDVLGFSLLPTTMGDREGRLVDPYVTKHRKEMVQSQTLATLLCSMGPGVYVYKHVFDAKLPFFKQKGPIKFKAPVAVRFNHFMVCHLTGRLGSGSFASVYAATFPSIEDTELMDHEVAMKHEKGVEFLPWEFYAIQTIHNRTKPSRWALFPRLHPFVIQVDQLHVYQNATFLCLERSYRGTLHDLVNTYGKHGKAVPENIAMFYTLQMLRSIHMVHSAHFLHGDIKPDNWVLLRGSGLGTGAAAFETSELSLIDFGRSIDLRLYPKDTCFKGDCHAKGFQCVEMLTKRPWRHQVDAFGVVATAHFLLFGDYIDVIASSSSTWCIKRNWKRYWRSDLWRALFDRVLNVPSCNAPPDLLALATMLERYYTEDASKTKELTQLLRAQDRMVPRSSL